MDYSAANSSLWNIIIQLGMIAVAIIIAHLLRSKLRFIKKSMMPVAVLAGFLLLIAKLCGLVTVDAGIMEILVYHGIALGFIAMSLRVPEGQATESGKAVGLKSGAVIVSSYMVQGVSGLIITILLGLTVMPDLFRASGLLLPMGFGQGPGQANNVGSSYEALGFAGGRSFGLAIAAAGYLVACIVGVIMLNVLTKHPGRREALGRTAVEKEPDTTFFQSKDELPVSDSIDRLSIQLALVMIVYLMTFLVAWGITSGLAAISPGLAATLNPLIWGFNFIIGSALAILTRLCLAAGRRTGLLVRQYQNNYLLNRISGFFFDVMIVAGIASINPEDIHGLWLPFVLLVIAGSVFTWLHLRMVCKMVYPGYYYEGLISMFGMMTGTISSGVLLLREIDPELKTPAAGNLVSGSSFGIILGAPVLVLVSLASKSNTLCFVTLGIAAVYYLVLLFFLRRSTREKRGAK